MNLETKLTQEEILAKLDQTSRKMRPVFIALTLFLVVILGVVSYFTYKALDDLSNLQKQVNDERAAVDGLRKEKEKLSNTIEKVSDSIDTNANVKEVRRILANVSNSGPDTPKPTPTPNIPKPPMNANAVTSTLSPRVTVYVQIADQSQRVPARQLISKLAGDKFKFPGIELVERKILKTQIRYFHENDKSDAANLAELLKKAGIESTIVYTPLKAENNLLEIWFSNDSLRS